MSDDVKARDPKHNSMNKPKDGQGRGWSTEDLYFDEEGRLYVANKDLADAIQTSMDTGKGRLTIYRDRTPGGKPDVVPLPHGASPLDRPGGWSGEALAGGEGEGAQQEVRYVTRSASTDEEETTEGTVRSGQPMNLMCPCAPEP